MNAYESEFTSREDYITRLYSVGSRLREHSKRYLKRNAGRENTVAEGLEHIAEHLEQNADIDPYSGEFPGILRSIPHTNNYSHWIANQMLCDPKLTSSEATTKVIQKLLNELARTAASHHRRRTLQ